MDTAAKVKYVYEFIGSNKLAVISTVSQDSLPQSAVVGISEKPNLELVFGTSRASRKYENLKFNQRVSLVIGWDKGKTVQYEGVAEELPAGAELDGCIATHVAKIPSAAKYAHDSEEAFFKVVPTWVRYTDLSTDPWGILEIKF